MRTLIALLLLQTSLIAQNACIKPFQFSIVPGLSTQIQDTGKCAHRFSLNLLAGYSGGVQGMELGGFANLNKGNVEGFQAAGFTNITEGDVSAAQFAGFCNVNQGEVKGFQAAGFTNVNNDSADVAQAAGFMNFNGKSAEGFQAAGFANINAEGFKGSQLAGFLNTNKGNSKGLSIAGFANISGGEYNGAMVSGFLNVAGTLNGTQIGIINVADSIGSGTPVGLINIARKGGYRALELTGNETFHYGLLFKLGTPRFYTMFGVGAALRESFVWAPGIGLGTMLIPDGKVKVNLDVLFSHINQDDIWITHVNMLNQLRLSIAWQLAKGFAISAGPSFNMLVDNSPMPGISPAPWYVHKASYSFTQITLYPGFQAALRF